MPSTEELKTKAKKYKIPLTTVQKVLFTSINGIIDI